MEETEKEERNLELERVNELVQQINYLNVNLLLLSSDGQYNYEKKANILNSLFAEIFSSCAPKEKEEGRRLRREIAELLSTKPVHRISSEFRFPHRASIKFNNQNWLIVNEKLFSFEVFLKELVSERYKH